MSLGDQEIRLAEIGDSAGLAALKLSTFRETFLVDFGIPYPPDDLALFEAEMYSVERVRAELLDPSHRTWVVEDGGQLAAYAHVGPCKLPHPDARAQDVELYQFYIRREAQGNGLGRRMLDFLLDPAVSGFSPPEWLGVWSGNIRAQHVYESRGFAKAGEYRFRVGSWFDEEFIFRRT